MSPNKNILRITISILTLIVIGGMLSMLVWKRINSFPSPNTETETRGSQNKPNSQELLTGPIRYNCELSSGKFEGGRCVCPVDVEVPGWQTQEDVYDKNTGFCQSTFGGPIGDAFNASVGLPYGAYDYWTEIIMNLCTNSGGNFLGAACTCPSGTAYNKTKGECK